MQYGNPTGTEQPLPALEMPQFEDPFANFGNPSDYTNKAMGLSMQASQGQSQLNALSQYPTFANPFGIGSQQPFGQPAAPDKSAVAANPSAANRGFNPWSLVGEANVR